MKIGASTLYGLNSKSVLESVEELERAGFDTIELMYEYPHYFNPQEIKKLKNKKLSFSLHAPFMGVMLAHLNPDFAKPQIKLIEQSLQAAIEIGCSHYVMHGGLIPSTYSIIENPELREYFVELFIKRFKGLLQKYSKMGIKIVIENLSNPQEIGGEIKDILKIQEAIPEIGFCFDIAHSELQKQTDEILNKLKIDHVHASDNNFQSDQHKVIGEGKINFKEIISKLKTKGLQGKIILENCSYADCKKSYEILKNLV